MIKLGKNFRRLSILNSDIIISGTAVSDRKLADFAANNNLSGFEFLSCIPGTVGGGLKMNAGCFDNEIKDILVSIQVIDKIGNVSTIPTNKISFGYKVMVQMILIFLNASFKGKKESSKIFGKMTILKTQKDVNQPSQIKTSRHLKIQQSRPQKAWELIKELYLQIQNLVMHIFQINTQILL